MPIGIIVHGGAGRFLDNEYPQALAACRRAVETARALLQQGASALDAVEAATRVLEADPILNAGYGATINRDGEIELDALIQDGATQRFGAVAGVRRIEHPVTLSRWIMERTPHHFLIAAGAEQFAAEQGMPLIDPKSLLTDRQIRGKHADTVGAVALDLQGNIAVAVSTGGVRGKLPGRVGDSPIPGAGGYAENGTGGASATGMGEGIMRALLCFRAVELIHDHQVQSAANAAIDLFTRRFDGDGGIIMLDSNGQVGIAHNTDHMPVAWLDGDKIKSQHTQKNAESRT
ncbi:MAG: isoaspartyl peptidase/L-asparaginase [Anaerolineae bacterium]|nr:isoaspartyl peptidase/L-asparaginase [Anaerolineae bacterium]